MSCQHAAEVAIWMVKRRLLLNNTTRDVYLQWLPRKQRSRLLLRVELELEAQLRPGPRARPRRLLLSERLNEPKMARL